MKIANTAKNIANRSFLPRPLLAVLALPFLGVIGTGTASDSIALAADQEYRAGVGGVSQDDAAEDPGTYARVRFFDGTLKLERYEDETVDDGAINSPIMPGDTASTSGGGRAEIQLAGGTVVRLDAGTRLSFLSLPAASGADAASDDATLLQLLEGGAEIEVRSSGPGKADFQIDTPSASIYLLSNGRYRIDIEGVRKKSRVSTYRGVAEVAGDEGSVMLRSGQRTSVDAGSEPDEGRAFNTASADSFDAWVQDRSGEYYRASAWNAREDIDEEEIPEVVRPYRSELSYYGRWVTIPQYGPCWMPSGVGAGWRPYYNGYWSTGLGGSFWVSNDPWGWAPYHYGRWSWYSGYGWVWIPGRVFSGAWVSWYYGPSYVGWAPLDFWDNPCALNYGSSGIDYHTWNFVTYQNVYVKHVTRIYVKPAIVRTEILHGTGVIVRRPVRVTPGDIRTRRITPEAVIRRARSFGNEVVVDPTKERVSKRTFTERERETVRLTTEARRSGGAVRPGSSAAPGGAAGRTDGGSGARAPRVQQRSGRTNADNRPGGPAAGNPPASRIPSRQPRLRAAGGDPGTEAAPSGRTRNNDVRPRRIPPTDVEESPAEQRGEGASPDRRNRRDEAPPPSRRRRMTGNESTPGPPNAEESGAPVNSLVPPRSGDEDPQAAAPGDQPLREFLRETGKRPGRAARTEDDPSANTYPGDPQPDAAKGAAPDTSRRGEARGPAKAPERPDRGERPRAEPRRQEKQGSSDKADKPREPARPKEKPPEPKRDKPAEEKKDRPKR